LTDLGKNSRMGTKATAINANIARWSGKNTPLEKAIKFTDDRRVIFLDYLAQTNRWYDAANAAQVSYQCVRDTIKRDEHFEALCHIAEGEYRNKLHAEAQRRAVEGTEEPVFYEGQIVGHKLKYSDRLLEIMLKRHDPAFRDNLTVTGGIDIQVGVLAVTANTEPITEDDWSDSHGGEKLPGESFPEIETTATVIEDKKDDSE